MLILTRRLNESVFIGEDIAITVLSITGKQVQIGIDAPSHVRVLRQEVKERLESSSACHEMPAP